MKKNVFITILVILVLGLCGYLVYDKVLDKDVKEEVKEESSKQELENYVGVAFSETLTTDWPTEELGKDAHEPNTLTKKADIPKILIDTNATKTINDKIYNDHIDFINMFNQDYEFTTFQKVQEFYIEYDYKVYNNILFIIVKTSSGNYRGGGSIDYKVYYYDIKNDKEFTVDEICSKYSIDLKQSSDESADKIYAVMPTYLGNFDVYYTQNDTCPSFHCQDMYTHIN